MNMMNWELSHLLELLIIWVVVYLIFSFLRGTRGAGILKGMALIFAVGYLFLYVLSAWLELEILTWLLAKLLPWSAFVMVVVFQPELRRGFVRLGQNPAFFEPSNREDANVSADIVEAVHDMSRLKCGALIVLAGDVGLKSFVEEGKSLDARVTSHLLKTIFWPGSPLHDGAVIVENGRIIAARCILVLSDHPDIVLLGTRHRAGLGITEESDAMSIVVSEETGKISVCVKGEIAQDVDLAKLETLINSHFVSKEGASV